jgi:solute carrier family 13 (sodium-dependent dicarboxylate transporter), member 2/3/5
MSKIMIPNFSEDEDVPASGLRQWLGMGIGLLAFVILLLNPMGMEPKSARVLAVAALMISWWVSEALPMPVVALLPLVLFPLLGIANIEESAVPYANPIIFLFMGGFLLGLAIEKWQLHRRIALTIVSLTGTSGNKIILGFVLACGFLSMWLSNTATTMMMFPIAMSVVQVVRDNHKGTGNIRHFNLALLLSIAYASNIGGIATIIGSPPNVAFVAFIQKQYHYSIQFIDWMLICMPLSILLLFVCYGVLVKWLFPSNIGHDKATGQMLREELHRLGPLSAAEKRVLIIFCSTAFLWIFKDIINKAGFIKLDDTIIAVLGALALFICPSGAPKTTSSDRVLEWGDTSRMAWGILLLFGGGISLANALEKAGLIEQLGKWIAGFSDGGGFLFLLIVTLVAVFVSEVMSNVAQVIVLAPVVAGIAEAIGMNPLFLGLAMTLGASCASMLPMGTPPNAIVFASGHIQLKHMLRAGLLLNIICIILISLFCWFILPMVIGFSVKR